MSISAPGTVARGTITIRQAADADNLRLCELFAGISMDAELQLSIRREPDFTALYRMQTDRWECWVGEQSDSIVGLGTILARDGYLDGQVGRVGYLGDLRISGQLPGMRTLRQFYGPALARFADAHQCDVYLTSIIASNARAIRALAGERSQQLGIPAYRLLRRFDIRAIHLTVPMLRHAAGFDVRRARPSDIPALARFLDEDARRRPFGFVFTEQELRRRLREWPGLRISNFYLALDEREELAGCCAVWDADPVKRTVVMDYRGSMRWVKRAYNVAAPVLRVPKLPEPGGVLRYAYLTHQAIRAEDPQVFRALLRAVYADYRASGYHFLGSCVLKDDPLASAYWGFYCTNLRSHLYVVTPPGKSLPPAALASGRPGFEMALV